MPVPDDTAQLELQGIDWESLAADYQWYVDTLSIVPAQICLTASYRDVMYPPGLEPHHPYSRHGAQ
jgi:hypothetical protein